MKLKYLIAAAAATCMTSTLAYAQDAQPTGVYIGANAGVAKVSDLDITYYDVGGTFGGTGAEDTFEGDFSFKDDLTFGGVIGYDFGMLRTDLEVQYARNELNGFTINRVNGAAVNLTAADRADVCDYLEADTCGGTGNTFTVDGARVRQLSGMANAWLDLPLGFVTPYAGGGVGLTGVEIDGEGEGRFTYQLGAGAAFQLTPGLSLTADYRHRRIKDSDIDFDANSGFRVSELKTNTFTAGLRLYFGGRTEPVEEVYVPAPPPPPPPPVFQPAPMPQPAPAPLPPVRPSERG